MVSLSKISWSLAASHRVPTGRTNVRYYYLSRREPTGECIFPAGETMQVAGKRWLSRATIDPPARKKLARDSRGDVYYISRDDGDDMLLACKERLADMLRICCRIIRHVRGKFRKCILLNSAGSVDPSNVLQVIDMCFNDSSRADSADVIRDEPRWIAMHVFH